MRKLLVLTLVLLALPADARRRAVTVRQVDVSTPAGWLRQHAHVLRSSEWTSDASDLAPLRAMIGDAQVVGLGDGTHGTHEFYTTKLRVIDFLVREMDFDVIAFEGPFATMNDLNAYVQTGTGDPRAILRDMAVRLRYLFWNTEEILALVEWMREYNAHRGDQPAIEIAGADLYDHIEASKDVVAYLRTVDPAAATQAENEYKCVKDIPVSGACHDPVARVHASLVARAGEGRAYHDAVQAARVVLQLHEGVSGRDRSMAINTLWMREHRGTSGKVIYWAHNEHVTKGPSELGFTDRPAGEYLERELGTRYFSVATMTAAGTYMQWDPQMKPLVKSHPTLGSDWYEAYFRQHGASMLLIPLRGAVPQWLSTPARWNTAGIAGDPAKQAASLTEKYDAAIFVDTTSAIRPLP